MVWICGRWWMPQRYWLSLEKSHTYQTSLTLYTIASINHSLLLLVSIPIKTSKSGLSCSSSNWSLCFDYNKPLIRRGIEFVHICSANYICCVGYSAGLTGHIKLDRYLHPHFRYYMREIRTVVYSQFLESYKSVTIEAMAKAFGVTVDFIDL